MKTLTFVSWRRVASKDHRKETRGQNTCSPTAQGNWTPSSYSIRSEEVPAAHVFFVVSWMAYKGWCACGGNDLAGNVLSGEFIHLLRGYEGYSISLKYSVKQELMLRVLMAGNALDSKMIFYALQEINWSFVGYCPVVEEWPARAHWLMFMVILPYWSYRQLNIVYILTRFTCLE